MLDRLLDTRVPGRGRIIFASLDGSDVTSVSIHLPVANRVVIDSRAVIHPLLALLERGRPAAVVLAAGGGADVLDWRVGEVRRLARVTSEPILSPSEPSGPIAIRSQRPGSPGSAG